MNIGQGSVSPETFVPSLDRASDALIAARDPRIHGRKAIAAGNWQNFGGADRTLAGTE